MKTTVNIETLFSIRDSFFDHVRRLVKGTPYGNRVALVKEMSESDLFIGWRHHRLLSSEGKSFFRKLAVRELACHHLKIDASIADARDQIVLTMRSKENQSKKSIFIRKKHLKIDRLENRYLPKFRKSPMIAIPEAQWKDGVPLLFSDSCKWSDDLPPDGASVSNSLHGHVVIYVAPKAEGLGKVRFQNKTEVIEL